jgi:phenylacetate-CoA ligase
MMNRWFYANSIYPLYHFAKRDGVNSALKSAFSNERLSSSQLALLQNQKLGQLLAFAAKHVSYYRELIGNAGGSTARLASEELLRKLPILTKQTIRRNRKALISDDLTGNSLIENSTSGSTGEALAFYTDTRSDAHRKAIVVRNKTWAGIPFGSREVSLWGAPMDEERTHGLRGRLHAWISGGRFLSSYDLSPDKMDEYIEKIHKFRPALLVSYPGPLEEFAKHCRKREEHFESLRAIITSAETLWPPQRRLIESIMRVPIHNRYGSREFGDIAQECQAHAGLHVNSDRVFIEILHENGDPCGAGQAGEICVTDLDNYGMPLIRYRIGDFGTWSSRGSCPCGRPFPLLESVEGRSMDVVRTPIGSSVGGTFWTLLLRSRPGIRQFQVVQESLAGIRIDYMPEEEPLHLDNATLEYFSQRIRERCGPDFQIEFRHVPAIDLTASGKRRLVISKV